jgi:hypothetical protein
LYPNISLDYPDYLDWRANQHSFEDIAVFRRDSFNLTGNGDPERVSGAFVTASYFRVLGVCPTIGRTFAESDNRSGGAGVILLSDRFWRNRFGADPKIIGATLVLNDVSYEVIGIAPPQLMNPENMDVYVPINHFSEPGRLEDRGTHPGLRCIGRLKPGVTAQAAGTEFRVIARNLEIRYPDTNSNISAEVVPLLDDVVGQYRTTLYLLLAVDQTAKTTKMAAFYDSLLQRIQSVPGTEASALGTNTPFNGDNWSMDFGVVGQPEPRLGEEPTAECESVSPDYFKTLKIQLIRGRTFDAEDRVGKDWFLQSEKRCNRPIRIYPCSISEPWKTNLAMSWSLSGFRLF